MRNPRKWGGERGLYYARSKKISRRFVREYVRTGLAAALIAEMD